MTQATKAQSQRRLLVTMTHEPFQPVRLYYRIPSRSAVLTKLRGLECAVEDPVERCWQWLYHGEMKSFRIAGASYEDVPKERRPIILGRIRFPKRGGMTLQTNSIDRAVQAAKFFAPRLGTGVVATRCRVVNRYFAADEGAPNELMKHLDRSVTVIDLRRAEAELRDDFRDVRSLEDADAAAAARMERKLQDSKDVPLVEDFPLAPEEETPDFLHLAMTLRFRFVRAFEHWRGNTHLTLTSVIMRTLQEQMSAPADFLA